MTREQRLEQAVSLVMTREFCKILLWAELAGARLTDLPETIRDIRRAFALLERIAG